MKYSLKRFISGVLCSELSDDQKSEFLEQVFTTGVIRDGLYLKRDEQGNIGCWYRNIDEKGITDRGPLDLTVEQIITEYKNSLGRTL